MCIRDRVGEPAGIGLRQKSLGPRTEQHAGKVHHRIHSVQAGRQGFGPCQVRLSLLDARDGGKPGGKLAVVDHCAHMLDSAGQPVCQAATQIAGGAGDQNAV